MLQTLSNVDDFIKDLGLNNIGLVLVDECHHIPAKTFRKVITKLNPYYLYGFTATPKRKNNDEKLIYIFLGKYCILSVIILVTKLKIRKLNQKRR